MQISLNQISLDNRANRLIVRSGNVASPNVGREEVMHADRLSAVESALLLGSFLTLAASLASLAAL